MKNLNKTTETILYSSLIAVMSLVLATSNVEVADAVTFGYWGSSSQSYYCSSGLSSIDHTANVSPCGDLSVAAGTWNAPSGSNWTFTSSPSSGVPVYGCNTAFLGYFTPTPSSADPITSGFVCMSKLYPMGNVNAGDSGVYDYITLAIHEFGHVPGIDHQYPWFPSSVMIQGQPVDTTKHTLHWTDVNDIEGLY